MQAFTAITNLRLVPSGTDQQAQHAASQALRHPGVPREGGWGRRGEAPQRGVDAEVQLHGDIQAAVGQAPKPSAAASKTSVSCPCWLRPAKIASKSATCKPPFLGAGYVWMFFALALANSRRSSSTSSTFRRPLRPRWLRPPIRTRSSMKPALPSKPTALAIMGPSKNSSSPASCRALRMVGSLLLEMMPSMMPAFLSTRKRGASSGARSRTSEPLRLCCARSPGVAVIVPSKSKSTARTGPAKQVSSLRVGSGVEGLLVRSVQVGDAQDPGLSNWKHLGGLRAPTAASGRLGCCGHGS
mmetsp:Transcript_17732/g.56135  ORF Transcript_17732/g.56135 Transcript_17732/m.56135 type:complete len:299 (-) Transcript_17732:502-1398(-)